MSKRMKIWLIIAAALVLIGCIIFGGVMMTLKWDFSKLSTVKFETNTYDISEEFSNILINTQTADIVFLPAEDNTSKVVCYEEEKLKHSISVEDGTLKIKEINTKKWYEYVGISIESPKITVYLSDNEYGNLSVKGSTGDTVLPENFTFDNINVSLSTGDVKNYASTSGNIKINTSTGNITVENVSCTALDLSVSTGKINVKSVSCEEDINVKVSTGKTNLTGVECKTLTSSGTTGKLSLDNVIAEKSVSIERDTGDVTFKGCDAEQIFVETSTGNVKGSLLSDKVFITKTDTGRVNVPKTINGGKCEIITDTGDIIIQVTL